MKIVFGDEKIYGCLVHYTRASMRHIRSNFPIVYRHYIAQKQENGFLYKLVSINFIVNGKFFIQIRRLMALPLLKSEQLLRFWGLIKDISNEEMENDIKIELISLYQYMEKQWISKRNTESNKLWDFNLLARTRSTNPAEAWHSLIKKFENI